MKKIYTVMATVLLAGLSAHSAVLFSEDYETGQTVGLEPTGAASVRPSTPTSEIYTKVVAGVTNTAGTGNGVEIKDNDALDVSNLEYNFVNSAGEQLSAVQIDFSFSVVSTNGAGDDYIAVSVGEYGDSRTLGASAARYLDIRLYNDGTVDFRNSMGASYSANNELALGASNSMSIFVNDYDSQSVNYTGLDDLVYVLPANSVAYWLNGSLVIMSGSEQYTVMDTDDPTTGGTVGTTTNNLGKFGFNTGTSDVDLDYVIDSIVVSTIGDVPTPPPSPLTELLTEDFEAGQTVGLAPTGATIVRPTANDVDIFTTVVSGSTNSAGSGNGVQMHDNGTADGCMLTYNFVSGTAAQLSAIRVDFDFSCLGNSGAGDDYYAVSVGEYSEDKTLNSHSARYIDLRLYNDGTIDFTRNSTVGGPYSVNNALVLGASNSVSIFVNDYDSQSINYTGLDDLSYTLPANSVAYWLNGSLVIMNGGEQYTTMDTIDPTAGGTVGTTENNLGKFGFSSGTSDLGLNYVVDNIAVYEIVQITEADTFSAWLAFYPALGSLTNYTDDAEADGMNNLVEYALGADPTVDDAADYLPTSSLSSEGGTNWLNYAYIRRTDAATRGLTYSVLSGTDLVAGNITNATEEVGAAAIDAGFEMVTNRISTAVQDTGFMRLEIGITE